MSDLSFAVEDTIEETTDIPLLGLSSKVLKQAAITYHPTPISKTAFSLTDEEKIAKIEQHFREILKVLGLNLENDSIAHTSYRVAKMYVKESFSGLNPNNFPSMCFIEESSIRENEQMILVKNISVESYCEHHFVPMIGVCHIAYIPNKKIIGLSKLNRIVEFHCKKPQLQERLTVQIADTLKTILDTEDIAVYTKIKHFCVTMRGIKDKDSTTETTILKGKLKKDNNYRQEFHAKIGS